MIICSQCGSAIEDGHRFCMDCGTENPVFDQTIQMNQSEAPIEQPAAFAAAAPPSSPPPLPPPTLVLPPQNMSASFAAPALQQTPLPTTVIARPEFKSPSQAQPVQPIRARSNKALIIVLVLIAISAMALTVYFVRRSSTNASRSSASQISTLAAALQSAVDSNRLVTLSNDDAYTYYFRLREQDPKHNKLTEIKPKVLPQLRSMGDEIIRRRVERGSEKLSETDWTKAVRVYEWAHALEPSEKMYEARWRYAEGFVAKMQGRKDDAERGFSTAVQLLPTWAVPHNDIGMLRTESRRYKEAISYYQQAITLEPNWEMPYNNTGTAYYFLKNYDTAESFYRQAIEKKPDWARPHAWLGSIYEERGQYDLAIEEYQTTLQLYDPEKDTIDTASIQKRINRLQSRTY